MANIFDETRKLVERLKAQSGSRVSSRASKSSSRGRIKVKSFVDQGKQRVKKTLQKPQDLFLYHPRTAARVGKQARSVTPKSFQQKTAKFARTPLTQRQQRIADVPIGAMSGIEQGVSGFTGADQFLREKLFEPAGFKTFKPQTTAGKVAEVGGGLLGYALGPGKAFAPLEAGIIAKTAPKLGKLGSIVAAESATASLITPLSIIFQKRGLSETFFSEVLAGLGGRAIFGATGASLKGLNKLIKATANKLGIELKPKQVKELVKETGSYVRDARGRFSKEVDKFVSAGTPEGKVPSFSQDPNNPRRLLRDPEELNSLVGAGAGFEVDQDEQGKLSVDFDPKKGIAGVGALAVGGKALKGTQNTKLKSTKASVADLRKTAFSSETDLTKQQNNKILDSLQKKAQSANKKTFAQDYKKWEKQLKKKGGLLTDKQLLNEGIKGLKKSTNEAIDVAVARPFEGSKIKSFRQSFFTSIESSLASMGEAGKRAKSLLELSRRSGDISAGKTSEKINRAMDKLTDKEALRFADIAEGRAKADTPALKEMERVWINAREKISELAQRNNVRIKGEDGVLRPFTPRDDHFPHFLPEEILNNKKVQKEALVSMVQSGWAKNIAEAETKFDLYVRNKVARRYGNLEKARSSDFPIYEKDPRKVLPIYIDSAMHRISDIKHFGENDENLYNLIPQIAKEGGDHEFALAQINRVLGKEAPGVFKEIGAKIRGFQTVTKLGLGAITNIGQSISTMLQTNPKVTIKAIGDAIGKNKKEANYFAQKTGELLGSSIRQFELQAGGDEKVVAKFLRKTKFTASEVFNRIVATNAGKMHAEDLYKALVKEPENGIARRALERINLDPDKILKNGLSEDDLIMAGKIVSEKTQFNTMAQDLPFLASSDLGKVLSQFKSFSFKQVKFIAGHSKVVAGEARQGNYRPLINTMLVMGIAAPIAGEVINDVKSILKNKKREEGGLERYFNNMFSTASLGLLSDVGTLATGKYGTSGTIGTLAGPTGSDAYKLVTGAQSLLKEKAIEPLAKLVAKNVPVAGPALNSLIPNKYTASFVGPNKKDVDPEMDKLTANVASFITSPKTTVKLWKKGEPIKKVRFSGDNILEQVVNFFGGKSIIVSERASNASTLDYGDKETQVDHIKPKWLGGREETSNYQIMTLEEHAKKTALGTKVRKQFDAGDITKEEAWRQIDAFNKSLKSKDITSIDKKTFDPKFEEYESSVTSRVKEVVEELDKLDKKEAAKAFEEIRASSPEAAKKIIKIKADQALGLTEEEQVMRKLGVANDKRSEAVAKEINKLETQKERADLWDEYVKKKIITKDVRKQLLIMKENGALK